MGSIFGYGSLSDCVCIPSTKSDTTESENKLPLSWTNATWYHWRGRNLNENTAGATRDSEKHCSNPSGPMSAPNKPRASVVENSHSGISLVKERMQIHAEKVAATTGHVHLPAGPMNGMRMQAVLLAALRDGSNSKNGPAAD